MQFCDILQCFVHITICEVKLKKTIIQNTKENCEIEKRTKMKKLVTFSRLK